MKSNVIIVRDLENLNARIVRALVVSTGESKLFKLIVLFVSYRV